MFERPAVRRESMDARKDVMWMSTMPPEDDMGRLAAPRSGFCVYNCDVAVLIISIKKREVEGERRTLYAAQLRLRVLVLLPPLAHLVLQLADRPRVLFAGCEELVVTCGDVAELGEEAFGVVPELFDDGFRVLCRWVG